MTKNKDSNRKKQSQKKKLKSNSVFIDNASLIILLICIFAAATCFYAAIVGFSYEGFYGQSFLPFSLFALCGTWYSIWAGARNVGILNDHKSLVALSVLFTGYAGPLLFLISYSVTRLYRRINSKYYLLLLFGIFGSSIAITGLFNEKFANEIFIAYYGATMYDLGIIAYAYYLHTLQLIVFTLLSVYLIIRKLIDKNIPASEKVPAKFVLTGIIIVISAISFSVILPFFNPNSILVKLGSTFTLPMIVITYFSIVNSRTLQRKALMLSERNETIERELRTARKMQAKLLPEKKHKIKDFDIHVTYLPMDKVGGDFYDIFDNDDILKLFIADVSGHGIPGAFIATISKILIKQSLSRSTTAAALLSALNNELVKYIIEGNFVTLFFSSICHESKVMTYSCAGHVPILIYRNQNDHIYELESTNPSLGWFSDLKYNEKTFKLQKNDRIILYTDGVIEGNNKEKEIYGLDRFKNFIRLNKDSSPEVFSNDLIEELYEFNIEDSFDDDIALIIVDIS